MEIVQEKGQRVVIEAAVESGRLCPRGGCWRFAAGGRGDVQGLPYFVDRYV